MRFLTNRRGNTVVELALVTPIILSLIGASVDLGLAYAQREVLAMAAKAGVEAASQLLVNRPIDGESVPPDVVQAVEDAVRSAARQLDASRLSVSVRWDGQVTSAQRQLSPYQVTLRIPVVENVDQTVDARHAHSYSWSYPAFSPNTAWPGYQPGVWYLDRINWSRWAGFGFWSGHWYPDRLASALWGWPNGPVVGFPWGLWFGAWSNVAGWFVRGFSQYDAWRQTDWRWAGNGAYVAGSPYDAWRRTWTDWFGITDRYWSQSGWGSSSGTSGIGGPVLDFTYGVRRPDREVTIQSLPVYQTIYTRPILVEASYPFTPLSPFLSGILRGVVLRAGARAEVTSAY